MSEEPLNIDGWTIRNTKDVEDAVRKWGQAGKSANLAALYHARMGGEFSSAQDDALNASLNASLSEVIGNYYENDKGFLLPGLFRNFHATGHDGAPVTSQNLIYLASNALAPKVEASIASGDDEKITSFAQAVRMGDEAFLLALQNSVRKPFIELASTDRERLCMLLAFVGTPKDFVQNAISDLTKKGDGEAVADLSRKLIKLDGLETLADARYSDRDPQKMAGLEKVTGEIYAGLRGGLGSTIQNHNWDKMTALANSLVDHPPVYKALKRALAANVLTALYPPPVKRVPGIWGRGKNAHAKREREIRQNNTAELRLQRANKALGIAQAIQDHPELREVLGSGNPNTVAYATGLLVGLDRTDGLRPWVDLCKKDEAWANGVATTIDHLAEKLIIKNRWHDTFDTPGAQQLLQMVAGVDRLESYVIDKAAAYVGSLHYDVHPEAIVEIADAFPKNPKIAEAAKEAIGAETTYLLGCSSGNYHVDYYGSTESALGRMTQNVKDHPALQKACQDSFASTVELLIKDKEWAGLARTHFQVSDREEGDPQLLRILNEALDRHCIARSFARHDERPMKDGHPDFMSELPSFSVAVFQPPKSEPIVWTTHALFETEKGFPAPILLGRIQSFVDQGPLPQDQALTYAVAPRIIHETLATLEAETRGRSVGVRPGVQQDKKLKK